MAEIDTTPLHFVRRLHEIPVEMEDPETGVVTEYVLREFDGESREEHLTAVGNRTILNNKGDVVGMKTFKGVESGIIARCLFLKTADGLKPAPLKEILSFPSHIQVVLADKAREICGLNEEQEDKAKND